MTATSGGHQTRRQWLGWAGTSFVLLGTALLRRSDRDANPASLGGEGPIEPSVVITTPPGPDWDGISERCLAAIAATHRRDLEAVDRGLQGVSEFFDRILPRVGPMLEDLFDLGSTAKILWFVGRDQLDGDRRVERYVAQFLAAYLELPDGLDRAFSDFEQDLVYALNRHEQELAIDLEAELAPVLEYLERREVGMTAEDVGIRLGTEMKPAAFGQASIGLGLIALDPGSKIVGRLREIGSRSLARLVPRLAASMGVKVGGRAASGALIAGGAASSWWTAGLSLIASLAITFLIESIVNKVVRSSVERHLSETLELLHREVVRDLGDAARREVDACRDRRVAQILRSLSVARSAVQEVE